MKNLEKKVLRSHYICDFDELKELILSISIGKHYEELHKTHPAYLTFD